MGKTEGRCQRCGTCCLQGGPALHREDRELFASNHLRLEQLVTIRKGEHVLWPDTDVAARTEVELIKLKGHGGEWRCRFFTNGSHECSIYGTRPLECRLFKCWSPDGLRGIIGRDTLQREDLLPADHPLQECIRLHEKEFPVDDILELVPQAQPGTSALLRLQELVRLDLTMRVEAMQQLAIAPDLELFLFGRPCFILLAPFGFRAEETTQGIILHKVTPATLPKIEKKS
jgi:Fe-S-cluster containining protein